MSAVPLYGADFSKELPPEILIIIMEWLYFTALNEPSSPFPLVDTRVRTVCWSVAQVCRYWREAALATPCLWTLLPRLDLEHQHSPSPAELENLKEIIHRARNAPLHVSITCTKYFRVRPMMGVLNLFLTLSNQWGSLAIDAPAEVIQAFINFKQGCIGRLESLRLYFLEWHAPEAGDAPRQVALQMFNDAPMLQNVSISGSPTAAPNWQVNLDTRSLAYLHVGMGSVIHSIKTTPGFEFSQLTTLVMWGGAIDDYASMANEEVTLVLPALTSLTYEFGHGFNPDESFLVLPVAPVLERLSITATRGDIATLLIDLHKRSTAGSGHSHPLKLLYLRVDLTYTFHNDYIKVFGLFPNLETLDMNLPAVSVLNALSTVELGTPTLVPRLQRCSFMFREDSFDKVHTALTRLAAERCERALLCGGRQKQLECQRLFELCIIVRYRPERGFKAPRPRPRPRPGFGVNSWVGILPTRLERWDAPDRQVQHSAYSNALYSMPALILHDYGEIGVERLNYQLTQELIELVEKQYQAAELVDFLEANTNICLISVAYLLRTEMAEESKKENSAYRRVVRLLKQVGQDILNSFNSLSFHWIWESSQDKILIRYIPDCHELRADPERFANAILGISDDMWIYDDF